MVVMLACIINIFIRDSIKKLFSESLATCRHVNKKDNVTISNQHSIFLLNNNLTTVIVIANDSNVETKTSYKKLT